MSQSRLHYERLFKHCKGVQYQTPLNFELFSAQKTHVNFSRSFCFLTSSFLNPPTQPPRGPSAFTVSTLKHQLLLACVLHAAVSSSVSNTSDPLCFIGSLCCALDSTAHFNVNYAKCMSCQNGDVLTTLYLRHLSHI